MNKLWILVISLLSLTLASCGHADASGTLNSSSLPGFATAAPSQSPAVASQALAVANQIRQQNGLSAMTPDPILTAIAQAHAEDMLRRHYFDHSTPEGQSPFDRMNSAGLQYNNAAENIAEGTTTPEAVFQLWLGSPAHRRNLLNNIYGRQGIGYAGGYWVHDFAN